VLTSLCQPFPAPLRSRNTLSSTVKTVVAFKLFLVTVSYNMLVKAMYVNVTLRRVRATIVAVEKQSVLRISKCVFVALVIQHVKRSVVQVQVSATGRSLVQRSPPECVCVCVCVIECEQVQK
jgi:hypothetical protein